MQVGFYTWGSCFVESPGLDGPDPYSRHHGAEDYERAYMAMLEWAKLADSLGYESFWLTEHHFQREGYEIIPNVVLLASVFAQHTKRIKFGSFFQVVPTWHPLRLAEDLAIADLLTDGRVAFGAGRGSVEREAKVFGAGFGRSGDEGDQLNRELFEEQMEIMRRAWEEPEFSFEGKHYTIPPAGILNTGNTATGRPWDKISLVPKPKRPIQIYQACNSDETLRKCAAAGNIGVIPFRGDIESTKKRWDAFGEVLSQRLGRPAEHGANRMLVLSAHVGEDHDVAMEELRVPVIERSRFLSQQRPVGSFPDGKPYPVGYVPSLEETLERGNLIVGSGPEVRDRIVEIVEALGVEEMAVEMGFPGMPEQIVSKQIQLFADQVRPALDHIGEPAAAV